MPKKTNNKKVAKGNSASHSINSLFAKIGEKTGVDKKKVDAWRSKWLAVPKNRTKYESLKDAPSVVGEEMFAMTNDIIDFIQGEHGGKSHVFGKLKEETGELIKSSTAAIKKGVITGKKKIAGATKGKGSAKGDILGGFLKKAKEEFEVVKKTALKAKERAKKGMAEAKKRAEKTKTGAKKTKK